MDNNEEIKQSICEEKEVECKKNEDISYGIVFGVLAGACVFGIMLAVLRIMLAGTNVTIANVTLPSSTISVLSVTALSYVIAYSMILGICIGTLYQKYWRLELLEYFKVTK